MFCPECGGEYRDGFSECADCGVALVATPPAPIDHGEDPGAALVSVLETGDAGLIAVAESLLLDAGIPYLKKGDGLQDLFALGRFGLGFNPVTGPAILQVASSQAAVAAEILRDVAAEGEDPAPPPDSE